MGRLLSNYPYLDPRPSDWLAMVMGSNIVWPCLAARLPKFTSYYTHVQCLPFALTVRFRRPPQVRGLCHGLDLPLRLGTLAALVAAAAFRDTGPGPNLSKAQQEVGSHDGGAREGSRAEARYLSCKCLSMSISTELFSRFNPVPEAGHHRPVPQPREALS